MPRLLSISVTDLGLIVFFPEIIYQFLNLFSPNAYQENDKTIYKQFKDKYDKIKRKP